MCLLWKKPIWTFGQLNNFIQVLVTWKMGTLISKPILASQASWPVYTGEPREGGTKEFPAMCSFSAVLLGVSVSSPARVTMQFHGSICSCTADI